MNKSTSIWSKCKKGVRAGNSPVWKPKVDTKHCQLCKHDVSEDNSAAHWFDGKPTCINCAAKVEAIIEDD